MATDDVSTLIVAIDRDRLPYADEVLLTVDQDDAEQYIEAAAALRESGVDVALIEHEYGIFGGPDGAHVLSLAKALKACDIPYIVTPHTVLSAPTPGQAATLRTLCGDAAMVTVFTETARRVAIDTGIAANRQIVVIPHGAPVTLRSAPHPERVHTEVARIIARLRGHPTLTTFGLLSEGKGIDIAIEALARVVRVEPRAQYVVAGATHPEVKRQRGEAYREHLRDQVRRLGLEDNVSFIDAFLSLDDLSAILHASTLFVTPYRSAEQICSGALTFALAAGLPVVSSAYRYAEDMLSGGAGTIVKIDDESGLSEAIIRILTNEAELETARQAAAAIASWLPWPTVAGRAAELVREVAARSRPSRGAPRQLSVPPLTLDHLDRLTDEIGILQFSVGDHPDPASGYCVDDVARLAIVSADLLAAGFAPTRHGALADRWLRQSARFLAAACSPPADETSPRCSMHNQLSYQGIWEDSPHVGDHVGRAIWSLGTIAGTPAAPQDVRDLAACLLDDLTVDIDVLASDGQGDIGLRTAAYALLGLAKGGRTAAARPLVDRLDRALRVGTSEDPSWRWFEPELTYDNARLPQALLAGALLTGNTFAAQRAIGALDWYAEHLRLARHPLRCVGNGWHRRGEGRERWSADDGDEQPIDAGALAEAFAAAWSHRADPRYGVLACHCLSWFLGRNRMGARLYVEQTGACHDGLSKSGVNGNQGAESTLAYQQAALAGLQAGLITFSETSATLCGPSETAKTGRTLAARATMTRPSVTDRSSTRRVRPTGAGTTGLAGPPLGPPGGGAGTGATGTAPSGASSANRPTTGHRGRTAEGHSDAR